MNLSLSCATIIYVIFSLFAAVAHTMLLLLLLLEKLHKIATCRRGFLVCPHSESEGGCRGGGHWSIVVSSICQKCRAIVKQSNASQGGKMHNRWGLCSIIVCRLSTVVWRDLRSSICTVLKLQDISSISFTTPKSRAPLSVDCIIYLKEKLKLAFA